MTLAGSFYIDTSAYLCILLGEAGSPDLQRELRGGSYQSSTLLVLETKRSLVRLSRVGELTADQLTSALDRIRDDLEMFELRDLSLDLCAELRMPIVSTPRSLDLAHLQTALWFNDRQKLTRFVTLDKAQETAARELSLPV